MLAARTLLPAMVLCRHMSSVSITALTGKGGKQTHLDFVLDGHDEFLVCGGVGGGCQGGGGREGTTGDVI
jgi:hypothetical protein